MPVTPPDDFWTIPVDLRRRVRAAVRLVESRGRSPSNPKVREVLEGSCASGTLAKLVRWHKQGLLPDRWDADEGRPSSLLGRSAGKAPSPAAGPSFGDDGIDESAERAELVRLVEAAQEGAEAELVELNGHVQRLLGLGLMKASEAGAHKQLLAERRLAIDAQRKAPVEDPDRVYPVTADAALVLNAFRRICSDARRERVMNFVAETLAEDLAKLPAVDPQGSL